SGRSIFSTIYVNNSSRLIASTLRRSILGAGSSAVLKALTSDSNSAQVPILARGIPDSLENGRNSAKRPDDRARIERDLAYLRLRASCSSRVMFIYRPYLRSLNA